MCVYDCSDWPIRGRGEGSQPGANNTRVRCCPFRWTKSNVDSGYEIGEGNRMKRMRISCLLTLTRLDF